MIGKGRFEQIMKIRKHLVKNEFNSCWESDQRVGFVESMSEAKLKPRSGAIELEISLRVESLQIHILIKKVLKS